MNGAILQGAERGKNIFPSENSCAVKAYGAESPTGLAPLTIRRRPRMHTTSPR